MVTLSDGSQRHFFLIGKTMSDASAIQRIAEAIQDAKGGPDRIDIFGSPGGLVKALREDGSIDDVRANLEGGWSVAEAA